MIAAAIEAARVCNWIKSHGSEFNSLCKLVDNEQSRGRTRLTRSTAYALAELNGIRISDDGGSDVESVAARNHNFWPCVTRYMVMLKPSRSRIFEFRNSKFDACDLVSIWHEVVSANTDFLAANRFQAQLIATDAKSRC